jgi:Rrf2 family nitric oxide-sensitive transcriptional repressor
MQLTLHTDYAFRVLLYLATQPAGHLVSTKDISRSYGISRHHSFASFRH